MSAVATQGYSSHQAPVYSQSTQQSNLSDEEVREFQERAISFLVNKISEVIAKASFESKNQKTFKCKNINNTCVPGTREYKDLDKAAKKIGWTAGQHALIHYIPAQKKATVFRYERDALYSEYVDKDLDEKIARFAPIQKLALQFLIHGAAKQFIAPGNARQLWNIQGLERLSSDAGEKEIREKSVFLRSFAAGTVAAMTDEKPELFDKESWWQVKI